MSTMISVTPMQTAGTIALFPFGEEDVELMKRLTFGEIFRAEWKKLRNGKFHRKFFALLKITRENMPHTIAEQRGIVNEKTLLIDLKILLGHYDLFVTMEGKPIYEPKSISFASMDQIEFEAFYQQTVDMVLQKYLVGMDERSLQNAVMRMVGFL